jgi:hypothetical protein
MSCGGHCFEIPRPELPTTSSGSDQQIFRAFSNHPIEQYTYSGLQPWQTRVLRLHPLQASAVGSFGECQLYADLLVATVSDNEGIVIEESGKVVEYIALSYSWGRPELSETLICNGKARPISSNNTAALIALRNPAESIYIWIDAVCIDQTNPQEKSAQVARMLNIYKKARSVVAWLGEPDSDSLLAFACIDRLSTLEEGLNITTHASSCLVRLEAIYHAFQSLHDRPLLRRTWIRQEIYGARRLVFHCGLQQVSWDNYIRAADLTKSFKPFLMDAESAADPKEALRGRLLNEAQLNATVPFDGQKLPRKLSDVLLQSQDFEVSDLKDTLYAILGMCNVTAFTEATAKQIQYPRDAVHVDYEKSVVEVYQDAACCVLLRKGELTNLADLWHFHKKSTLHGEGLPQWAVDWREGVLDGEYRTALRVALQSPESGSSALWTPLGAVPEHGRLSSGHHHVPNEASAMTRVWHWPEPIQSDPAVLCFRVRVLNYVAHLTDFTCDPMKSPTNSQYLPFAAFVDLGLAGLTIHAKRMLRVPGDDDALVNLYHHEWKKFNPRNQLRRLAILGVGNDMQLCLVPRDTKKGDLVVAIAPGLLPMVISPKQADPTAGGLILQDDPYEKLTSHPQTRFVNKQITVKWCFISMISLLVIILGFNISLMVIDDGSLAATVVLACYGVWLFSSLAGYLMHGYLNLNNDNAVALGFAWVYFVFSVVTFPIALIRTTGIQHTTIAIYFGLTIATLPNDFIWRNYRDLDHGIERYLRRKEVFQHLDSVTERLGRDYTFIGPVLVRSGYRLWGLPKLLRFRGLRWCAFRVAVLVEYCTKRRPRFGLGQSDRFDRLFLEDHAAREVEPAWERPLQEFRLH